jgi:hypothetical protein
MLLYLPSWGCLELDVAFKLSSWLMNSSLPYPADLAVYPVASNPNQLLHQGPLG